MSPTMPCCASVMNVAAPWRLRYCKQLVQVQDDELLLRHGRMVAVEAVDRDDADAFPIDQPTRAMGEFARRQLGGVHLLDEELACIAHALQVDAEALGAGEQEPELLVEDEQGGALAARDRGGDELEDEKRFAGARRTDNERARAGCDAAAQQRVERSDAAPELAAGDAVAMLGGDQPRKQLHAARGDDEIVVAARNGCPRHFTTRSRRRSPP